MIGIENVPVSAVKAFEEETVKVTLLVVFETVILCALVTSPIVNALAVAFS